MTKSYLLNIFYPKNFDAKIDIAFILITSAILNAVFFGLTLAKFITLNDGYYILVLVFVKLLTMLISSLIFFISLKSKDCSLYNTDDLFEKYETMIIFSNTFFVSYLLFLPINIFKSLVYKLDKWLDLKTESKKVENSYRD